MAISTLAVPSKFGLRALRPRDEDLATAVCIHITGKATYRNAKKAKQDPLWRLARYFVTGKSACSHYGIGGDGTIQAFTDEDNRSNHAIYGSGKGRKHALKWDPPRWWIEEWTDIDLNFGLLEAEYTELQTIEHPCDLVPTTPNGSCISIEIIQVENQLCPTPEQMIALTFLVGDICRRQKIPTNRLGILGHEDLVPWTRGNAGGGWDPGFVRDKPTFDLEIIIGGWRLMRKQLLGQLADSDAVYFTHNYGRRGILEALWDKYNAIYEGGA